MQSEQINELAKALAAAQAEIEDPAKTKTAKVPGKTAGGLRRETIKSEAKKERILQNAQLAAEAARRREESNNLNARTMQHFKQLVKQELGYEKYIELMRTATTIAEKEERP